MAVRRIVVKCEYCNKNREIYSNNKSKLCASCAGKKIHNSLELHDSKVWISPCKTCNEIRTYTHIKSWKQRRDNCVSCSQITNTNHYNAEYRKYRGKVWTETNKQPISILENFNKRGRSGNTGAYQLDHIISIKNGFDNKIEPCVIGNIVNLQMLTWEDNRKKGL